jgi:hypothetical protein
MTSDETQTGLAMMEKMTLVAQRFVTLADTLVDDFDVVELLDRLVADCVDLLDIKAAGILLLSGDGVLEVVASSNEASHLMEVFQLESHEGPCIEAVRTGRPVSILDSTELTRWPDFAVAVDKVGFTAVYAFPMRLRNQTIGALNLFSGTELSITDYDHGIAQALADIATIGILQQRSLSQVSLLAEQLQTALASRIMVEQAKGVVAEYSGVDMGAAFEALRSYSRKNHVKLGDVATRLVSRDLLPELLIEINPDRRIQPPASDTGQADEREAGLDRREKAQAERVSKADVIIAAADQRDTAAEARDLRSTNRENALDKARFLAHGDAYDPDASGRREAGLDREHAKDDRSASKTDRVALTEDPDDRDAP